MKIIYRCVTEDGLPYLTTEEGARVARRLGHSVQPTTPDQITAAWRAKGYARKHDLKAQVEAPSEWYASVPDPDEGIRQMLRSLKFK